MPEEKKKPSEKEVDIDTSGPEVDVAVEEPKRRRSSRNQGTRIINHGS